MLRRLHHLDELQAKARDVNRRVLDHEHVGQGCVLASPAFERIARPSCVDGRRAPALRFGDPRVMALAGALAMTINLVGGFSNRTLRPALAGLLGEPYSQSRCCYDLRRRRLKGLITKLPRSNTYVHTDDGQRFAIFYTKVHNRALRPLLAAHQPPAPLAIRQALRTPVHASVPPSSPAWPRRRCWEDASMPSSVELIRVPTLAHADYAYAATAPKDARLIFLAGACPLNDDGTTAAVGDYAGQAAVGVETMLQALTAAGATIEDVISTRVLVASSAQADLVAVWQIVRAAFGEHDAPSTLVGVTALGYSGQLVELEAIAAVVD